MMDNNHAEFSDIDSSHMLSSSTKIQVNSSASFLTPEKQLDKQNLSQHTTRRLIENFVFIWFDTNRDNIDQNDRHNINQIRHLINVVYLFSDIDECVDFVTNIIDEKVFIVVAGVKNQYVVPLIHNLHQLDSIYLFNEDNINDNVWTKQWKKIRGCFNQIEKINDRLKQDVQRCNNDMNSISTLFLTDSSIRDLNKLDQSFMYSEILKEILLEIDSHENENQEYIAFCRYQYADNHVQLRAIDEFEKNYHLHSPLWWYSKETFVYSMLNHALRTQDIEIIIKMGFFVRDLHRAIEYMHSKSTNNQHLLTVYRGQGMPKSDFEMLKKNIGGLLSFKNFLSTSSNQQIAHIFADSARLNSDLIGILFCMEIDSRLTSVPFTALCELSQHVSEDEILFSMHTIFRIGSIRPIENNMFEVDLVLASNDDEQLTILKDCLEHEIKGERGWNRMGQLMIKIGEFNQAEKVYNILCGSITTNDQQQFARLQNQLGYINHSKGNHSEALSLYTKAVEIQERSPATDPDGLAVTYNNIGLVYNSMKDFSSALTFYQQALRIREEYPTSDHMNLADLYNNIGHAYHSMENYSSASMFYHKTLAIYEKTLPSVHPSLAVIYGNIGGVYQVMANYRDAISMYEKVLQIQEKSLPANHPNMATTYSKIGRLHELMGKYAVSFSSFSKALEIRQNIFHQDHPDLATSYNNIGRIYHLMNDYSNALSSYERAIQIRKKNLPLDYTSLASALSNVGSIYQKIGKHDIALSFYQQALESDSMSLQSNHDDLISIYNNIGETYRSMGDYSNALSYLEKGVQICQPFLPLNHPSLAFAYNNIGLVHDSMNNFEDALLFYKKALQIREKILSTDHPSLAISYNNMSYTLESLGQCQTAFEYAQRALEIARHAWPHDHPYVEAFSERLEKLRKNLE